MRMVLRGATLVVNEQEVMLLHLAQSKFAWAHARRLQMPPWAPPPLSSANPTSSLGEGKSAVGSAEAEEAAAARMWASGCFEVHHLANLNATCRVCSKSAPTFSQWGVPGAVEKATRLRRHRVQSEFRGHILYPEREEEVRLEAHACTL